MRSMEVMWMLKGGMVMQWDGIKPLECCILFGDCGKFNTHGDFNLISAPAFVTNFR